MPRGSLLSLGARTIELSFDGAEPPTEFRLFKAGENETTKGVFLFDDKAAALVMAAAREQGVDFAIDLEHLSIDRDERHFDPNARGWFNLELRGGELWAVNVRWTSDGARRLGEKTQRYVSPAFRVDDDNRVTEIINVALVAQPATHGTPALVAANRSKKMSVKHSVAARLTIAKSAIKRLADDGADGGEPAGKFASVQAAAKKAEEALAALENVKDVDQAMSAAAAAVSAMQDCESAIAALTGAQSDPAQAAAAADPKDQQMADDPKKDEQTTARDLAELRVLRAEKVRREEDEKVTKLATEMQERAAIEAELVKLGRETPATVKDLADLPIGKLRARVDKFKGSPRVDMLGRVAPPPSGGAVTAAHNVEITEFEIDRVKHYAAKKRGEYLAAGRRAEDLRTVDEAVERYQEHRLQQFNGAKTDEAVRRLGRGIEQGHVLLSRDGRMVTLTSTPVKPIEEFGASSQRALEEFRMNYNMALAATPKVWAETLGDMMQSGSVNKDTYPINLSATRYVKKTAQSAAAETSLNFDISVTKDEFYAGEEVELRRLVGGDFAHVLSWNRRAERMANARVFLRNALVTTILEAGESGYWGSSSELATGIDGQPFFSATHKVHPRDASKKLRGVATWSNFQSSAKVLNAANLTAEKVTAFQVADPTGHEFGFEYDCMLVPSSLNEVAKNLLTVQDLIIEAGTVNGVSNTFAATRNPHFQSGMVTERAPDLAGTDTTADWYMLSRQALAAGLFPWLISEDGSEDLRTWDESSDFYKDSGLIKVTSHIFLAAVLLFPHGIRKVSGT